MKLVKVSLCALASSVVGCSGDTAVAPVPSPPGPAKATWTGKTSMLSPRQVLGVAVHDGIIYAVGGGGWSTASYTGALEVYDPKTNAWDSRAPMPTARGELAAAFVNGRLYAVGGFATSDLNTLESYDPSTNTWTERAPMPTAREGIAAGVIDGILYVVGGNVRSSSSDAVTRSSIFSAGMPRSPVFDIQSSEHVLATLEAYNPVTNSWKSLAPMPTPRSMLAVGVVNGILYAIGGRTGSNSTAAVEAYNPSTNRWTQKASMPSYSAYGRGALAAGVMDGLIYAVGGFVGYQETDLVEAYDVSKDTWQVTERMPTMRQSLGVGVVDGVLYAVGGACYDDTFDLVEAFKPR